MHTGDKFENITQSIIATRQSIATGIVQVESSGQKQLAGALSQLEGAISQAREGEMSAADKKEALELLNEVTKHAASPGRSAAVTKSLADGLWEKVKTVTSVAKIAADLWPLIRHLWQ